MAASSSARVISIRSFGAVVPCPPVTKSLMTRAPRLISSRTPSRNDSAPSQSRTAPEACLSQYHGTPSLLWPVVDSSRDDGQNRGPGIRPSSMARRTPGSTWCEPPAPTTPVYPCSNAVARLRAAIRARYAGGYSSP